MWSARFFVVCAAVLLGISVVNLTMNYRGYFPIQILENRIGLPDEREYKINLFKNQSQNIRCVILGSSVTTYIPSNEFECAGFNFSVSGMLTSEYRFILNEILSDAPVTKVFISVEFFASDQNEIERISSTNDLARVYSQSFSRDYFFSRLFSFQDIFSVFKNLVRPKRLRSFYELGTDDKQARKVSPTDVALGLAKHEALHLSTLEKYREADIYWDDLQEIVKWQSNTEVVFFIPPVSCAFMNLVYESSQQSFENWFERVIVEVGSVLAVNPFQVKHAGFEEQFFDHRHFYGDTIGAQIVADLEAGFGDFLILVTAENIDAYIGELYDACAVSS